LGSTEGGSAGIKVWQTNQPSTRPQPFGILNSVGVLLANDAALAWYKRVVRQESSTFTLIAGAARGAVAFTPV